MPEATIVVPCFNEAGRLQPPAFRGFVADHPDVKFLFVDDGSTDETLEVLRLLEREIPGSCRIVSLARNVGKAEAVRAGLLQALEDGSDFVGFWDADLATPLAAIDPFCELLERTPELLMVVGARVQLLGRQIERSRIRHYFGRAFATVISTMLRIPVYDTQCGAKLFRADPMVRELLSEPFVAKWIFDVEIFARMIVALDAQGVQDVQRRLYEYPLERWTDVSGTKLRLLDFVRAALDTVRIRRSYLTNVRTRPRS